MSSLGSKTQILCFWDKFSKLVFKNCTKGLQLGFHVLWELRVQILKNHENKAKRTLLTFFPCPLYALFEMEFFLSKVLQKCFLTQINILDSLWNWTNLKNLGKKQQRFAWKAKHKPCIFGLIISSWLSKLR